MCECLSIILYFKSFQGEAKVRFSSKSKRRRSSVASAIFRNKNKSSEAFVTSSSGGGALNFGGSDRVAVYKGQDGKPLDKDTVEKITRFQVWENGKRVQTTFWRENFTGINASLVFGLSVAFPQTVH
jgi:hypothetical protein